MGRLRGAIFVVAFLVLGGVAAMLLADSGDDAPEEALEGWFADLRTGDFERACENSVPELDPTFAQFAEMAPADTDDPPLPPPDELTCPESLAIVATRVFSPTVGLEPDLRSEGVEGDKATIGVGDGLQVFDLERVGGRWRVAGFGFGEGRVDPARPPITLGD